MRNRLTIFALTAVCITNVVLIASSPMAQPAYSSIQQPDLKAVPVSEDRVLTITEIIAKYGRNNIHKYRYPEPKDLNWGTPMSDERLAEHFEKLRKNLRGLNK